MTDGSRAPLMAGPELETNVPLPNGRSDVLIAGGGFAGLALAIALRQALGRALPSRSPIPIWPAGEDARASAIAAAPRRMFEALGVWAAVADEAQPILDMVVTDSRVDDAVRPVFLTFGGEIEPGEPFAHMVENGRLIAALAAKAAAAGVDLIAAPVTDFTAGPRDMTMRSSATVDADRRQAPGRCRRRPLAAARTRRHRGPWLVLWPVRDRHDGRP